MSDKEYQKYYLLKLMELAVDVIAWEYKLSADERRYSKSLKSWNFVLAWTIHPYFLLLLPTVKRLS